MRRSTTTSCERATAFLEENATRRPSRSDTFVWGEGDDSVRSRGPDAREEERLMAEAAAWRAKAFDAGFAWAGGPKEYGGGGLDPELNDLYASPRIRLRRARPGSLRRRRST